MCSFFACQPAQGNSQWATVNGEERDAALDVLPALDAAAWVQKVKLQEGLLCACLYIDSCL